MNRENSKVAIAIAIIIRTRIKMKVNQIEIDEIKRTSSGRVTKSALKLIFISVIYKHKVMRNSK
jgi:hypothetical protein